jgi:hypothetical protein
MYQSSEGLSNFVGIAQKPRKIISDTNIFSIYQQISHAIASTWQNIQPF